MVAGYPSQWKQMKATVAGLVTPHVLRVVDLAEQADTGTNVDWHVRDAVNKTIDELAGQYNAPDLLSAYMDGLQSAIADAGRGRWMYATALKSAAAIAARRIG
jgi:hypothetical protein